ncbi:MAG: hypothetical protein OEM38_00960 [Gammaproteobacteria bacterium]|nr:hypothetical protein [Gammaproteobacteria bacterium]
MDKWMMENVENIMFVVEVVGFALVASMFILYFIISRRVKKKRLLEQEYED